MYRLIEKLHLERYLNSRLILAIDLVVSGVASLCALVLVRLLLPPLSNISKFALLWIGCAVVYSFITFFLLKTYRSVIRHSTLREIAKFVVAVIGKELLLGLTILLYPPTPLFGMHMLALLLFDLLVQGLQLCAFGADGHLIGDVRCQHTEQQQEKEQPEHRAQHGILLAFFAAGIRHNSVPPEISRPDAPVLLL